MINELDLKKIREALHTQELKELNVRLLNEALLASTTITAPEIRLCLHQLTVKLADEKNDKKVKPNRVAE